METPLSQEQNNVMTETLSMVTAATPTAPLATITVAQHPLLTRTQSRPSAQQLALLDNTQTQLYSAVQLACSAARPAPTLLTA